MNMAENPNDKALREKLLSAEYAYDPAAWAAMEQLMERKKKRGLLWWWLSAGAVAVALLVSAGVYFYTQTAGKEVQLAEVSTTTNSAAPAVHPNNATNRLVETNTPAHTIASASDAVNVSVPSSGPATTTAQKDINHTNTAHSSSISPKKNIQSKGKTLAKKEDAFVPFDKSQSHKFATAKYLATATSTTTGISVSNAVVAASSASVNADDLPYPAGIELNNSSGESNLAGTEGDAQTISARHKHRIAISYSLGAETGVFASYVRKTWSGVPTWSVGLSQQLNIGKYLAITNSILYSEVNFKVNAPVYPVNPYNDLNSYRSRIKELAVPIGIKVYPYTSRHLRISAGVSYINHIKINETFSYQLTPKAPPTTMIPSATADFPFNNNFNPGYAVDGLTTATPPVTQGKLMEYYSLGNGRRYYGSMMYTIGLDILLPHRISLSAEPAMRMSIDQIKMQNSRVFDVGMNAGIRYTF